MRFIGINMLQIEIIAVCKFVNAHNEVSKKIKPAPEKIKFAKVQKAKISSNSWYVATTFALIFAKCATE